MADCWALIRAVVICIGFNHHHKTSPETWDRKQKSAEELEEDGDEPFDTGDYNPEGKRLWSWLVLCDDGIRLPPACSSPQFRGDC